MEERVKRLVFYSSAINYNTTNRKKRETKKLTKLLLKKCSTTKAKLIEILPQLFVEWSFWVYNIISRKSFENSFD